ncbi:MAG TPA: hypothetical protein VK709_06395 [Candidatus Saccharimonadales bacterium]|nr:hypothetical protein [Candidatus Saccharimonadales bacterium]
MTHEALAHGSDRLMALGVAPDGVGQLFPCGKLSTRDPKSL